MTTQELKQVIVVNAEIGLPKGKLAAQVAHAAVAAFLEATPKAKSAWLSSGMPKVVLKASTEAVLQELEAKAQSAGLPVALIQDAAAAQLEPLTGELKLLWGQHAQGTRMRPNLSVKRTAPGVPGSAA